MELFLGVIFVIAIYFLPGIVAHVRGHNDENSIVLLNFFGCWTLGDAASKYVSGRPARFAICARAVSRKGRLPFRICDT